MDEILYLKEVELLRANLSERTRGCSVCTRIYAANFIIGKENLRVHFSTSIDALLSG